MSDDLLSSISTSAIDPAMAMLPGAMDSPAARVMMLTIGLQESGLTKRAQILDGGAKGAARGLWQMESGGGVRGVLTHPASRALAIKVCQARGVNPDAPTVWAKLEFDDVLAAAFARLLIFTDPLALPDVNDTYGSWRLYALRCWRPGKPKPDTWGPFHDRAKAFVLDAT